MGHNFHRKVSQSCGNQFTMHDITVEGQLVGFTSSFDNKQVMFLISNLFKQSQVVLVVIICKVHHSTAVAMVTSQPLEACIALRNTPELELHRFSFCTSFWCFNRCCSIQMDRFDPTSLKQACYRTGP